MSSFAWEGIKKAPADRGKATGAPKTTTLAGDRSNPPGIKKNPEVVKGSRQKRGNGWRRALARNRLVNLAQTYRVRRSNIGTLRSATQEAAMDRLAEMVRYVRQKNIDRYRKLLDEPTDPLRRQQLQQQLAELESAQQ